MTKIQGPIGVSLIYIGSMVLTLNFIGWVCFGASLRFAMWFFALWALGILIAAIEPRRRQSADDGKHTLSATTMLAPALPLARHLKRSRGAVEGNAPPFCGPASATLHQDATTALFNFD